MYMYGNTVSLYYRTAQWMFTKLGRDEVIMALHIGLGFVADPPRVESKAVQKCLNEGPLFQRTYSSDLNATATNRMHPHILN